MGNDVQNIPPYLLRPIDNGYHIKTGFWSQQNPNNTTATQYRGVYNYLTPNIAMSDYTTTNGLGGRLKNDKHDFMILA